MISRQVLFYLDQAILVLHTLFTNILILIVIGPYRTSFHRFHLHNLYLPAKNGDVLPTHHRVIISQINEYHSSSSKTTCSLELDVPVWYEIIVIIFNEVLLCYGI